MLYHTSFQFPEFMALICAGMLMGAVSMLLSAIRRLICAGKLLTLASDLILGVLWAIIFCASITLTANGRLRIFHVIALATGAALFYFALTLPLRHACACVCRQISRLIKRMGGSRLCRILFK